MGMRHLALGGILSVSLLWAQQPDPGGERPPAGVAQTPRTYGGAPRSPAKAGPPVTHSSWAEGPPGES